MLIPVINKRDEDFDERLAEVRDCLRGGELTGGTADQQDVPEIVRQIIADVRDRGDEALLELTARHDKVELESCHIQVSEEELDYAHSHAQPEFMALVRRVIGNIRQYQEHILISPPKPLVIGQRSIGVRYTPVDRVGVYVPGGRAFYPSTVLMTVVPALVAGVRHIAIASPPSSNGDINPMVLALARELGVSEVYRIGGAQAVAALAMGTESVHPVDKIVGPGNAFVAEAKRQLLGQVGIDSIAGPSEVLIIADHTADPQYIAADMIAQAEHDPGSAVLVTVSPDLAHAVVNQIERSLVTLERAAAVRQAMERYSAVIVLDTFEEAAAVANEFATEHLQIITADNARVMSSVRHAGAIFLGPHTPVPLGDYYAGPSHVLPTGGTARFFSALSCNDFLKASSVIEYGPGALAEDAEDVINFATREGLTGHAEAVRVRSK